MMRTKVVWLTALSLVFMGWGPIYAQVGVVNLLANGGFEDGTIAPYGTYGDVTSEVVTDLAGAAVPEDPIEGNYCLHLVVPAAGANNWDVGMTDGSHTFEAGKKYTFSAFLKCKSDTLQVRLKPERGADPWEAYNEVVVTVTDTWTEYYVTTPVITEDVTPASPTFHFAFAPGDFWVDGVKLYEGDYVPTVFGPRVAAVDPNPEDGAVDIPRDVVLGWKPGVSAARHDVYFGTGFDDVNDADTGNPLGVEVSLGQTALTFDPPDVLDFGRTYYWRVDEVNAPPDSTVFKGSIWSFTVEPFAYPVTNITATASSTDKATQGPENTINGSGLDENDLHSWDSDAMWVSSMTGPQPTWIQYEFDKPYKLLEMWVWNYNVEFEVVLGFGLRDVTIETSLDGDDWTVLTDTEFARGPAANGYAHDTVVDFEGVMARYVRLTANSNWGGFMPQYGLSEVRFYYVPLQARGPSPASGAYGVPLDVVLDWRDGREAVSHDVYLSTDEAAVAGGTALVDTVSESRYQPSALEFAQSYYWRVDEVNEAATPTTREGDVWSFMTTEYVAIDDFESYVDEVEGRIFQTWIDGFGYTEPEDVPGNGTGSTVGNLQAPFAERSLVNSGSQAMPMEYDNSLAPFYSEAERTWAALQNWTSSGADTLWVHFRGNADNDADQLYVAVQDSSGRIAVVTHPDPDAVLADQYQQWAIPLSEFTSAGVNMASVRKMMIGVGDRDNPQPDGIGKLYIDDIRFGRPVEPIGLVAYYALENNTQDGSGNDYHGIAVGGPSYVNGPVGHGTAMEFDGTGAQYVDLGTFDPSALTRKLSVSLWARWNGLTDFYQGLIGKRDSGWAAAEMMWQIEANQTVGDVRFQREGTADIVASVLPIGEWTHVAATFDGTTGKLYLDGQLGAEGAFSFGSDTEAAIQFGASVANGGNPFNGALDEIRLYDVVLSETEILELAGQ